MVSKPQRVEIRKGVVLGKGKAPTVPPPPAPKRRDPYPVGRILYNKRGGEIDEIVLCDVEMVHVEQMDDDCWWIGIRLKSGGYWAGNFYARSKGRLTFTQQERDGFEWDDDRSHDDHPTPRSEPQED